MAGQSGGREGRQGPRAGTYRGPTPWRGVLRLVFPEGLILVAGMALIRGFAALPTHVWGALSLVGVAAIAVLAVGPTILREARWDETGVEFRWLYGGFHFYAWDELRQLRRPSRWSEKSGTGLVIATTRGETITVDWRGENYQALAEALLERVQVAERGGKAER